MSRVPSRPTRPAAARARLLGGLAAVLLAGACSAAGTTAPGTGGGDAVPSDGTSASTPSSSTTPPQPADLLVSPADRASEVLPSAPVTVRAVTGRVEDVKVVDERGASLPLEQEPDGSWKATARLRPSATYTVTSRTVGPDGTETTDVRTFATLVPRTVATYGINYSGQTVGVGMPVAVQFDSAVATKEERAAVEKAVRIDVTPAQPGSWGWLDDRQLMWRPKTYWQPGTRVSVSAPLTGLQTGPDKWVGNDDSGGFTVGAATVSHVDIARHFMTVTQNGTLVRSMPISAGKDVMPYITRSGTKVIIEKLPWTIMDAATSGIPKTDPEYYREKVELDLRLTWTGEFIHSAPWSVTAQGHANVSHGCVNLSPENAKWMYDFSKVGDVVIFTGSNRPFRPTEGLGVWQYDWAGWQARSALSPSA